MLDLYSSFRLQPTYSGDMSYFSIVQQIFTSLTDVVSVNTTDAGPPTDPTEVPSILTNIPNDGSSLFALLFSLSALRDWLKLIVIGGFFETCRRLILSGYTKLVRSFFISASFEQGDSSYGEMFLVNRSPLSNYRFPEWILLWITKQPSWSICLSILSCCLSNEPTYTDKTRDVHITTRSFGKNSPAVELDGEDDNANQIFKSSRKISYLPSTSLTYSLWYQRRWMTITRVQQQTFVPHVMLVLTEDLMMLQGPLWD